MAGKKLDELPPEIIQQVGTYVRAIDRLSLYALGLANHHLHIVIASVIFEHICLRICSRNRLRVDVPRWLEVLSRNEALRHVRRLDIIGHMPILENEKRFSHDHRSTTEYPPSVDKIFGSSELPEDDHDEMIDVSVEQDRGWLPAAELITALPHLTSLVYDCNTNLSPCLLKAVHSHHPQCKLNIKSFRFRSLEEENVAPHELALVASPCLHAITVGYTFGDLDLGSDNQEAALLIVAGLALNVKHLRVVRQLGESWGDSGEEPPQGLSMNRWVPQVRCKGLLSPILYCYRHRGRLESLSITGDPIQTYRILRAWARHTDFAVLRHLDLECGVTKEVLDWANAHCSFPILDKLILKVYPDDDGDPHPTLMESVMEFLVRMPPLETLDLTGALTREYLGPTLDVHGASLRTFHAVSGTSMVHHSSRVPPLLFGKNDVAQMRTMCPQLEDLQLSIRRTKSDARECSIYHELAQIRSLRALDIVLDCSDHSVLRDGDDTPSDPSFDEYEREFYSFSTYRRPRKGHIRDALLNVAMDEALIRSIWHLLCGSNRENRLQSLKVGTAGGASFGGAGTYMDEFRFMYHMSRTYLLRRNPSGVDDAVVISEMNQWKRVSYDRHIRELQGGVFDRENRPGSAMEIFRRIWPPKEGSVDWRDDWESIPVYLY